MSAPTAILLHGVLGGPVCWAPLESRFPGAAAIRLPGHPEGDATADLEAAVHRVVRAVRRVPGPRVVVAHGVGAALAIEAALQDPALLDGIVAIGLAAEMPVSDAALLAAFTDAEAEAYRLLRASITNMDTGQALRIADQMERSGARTLAADYQLCRQVRLAHRLTELRPPVMLIAGGDDTWATSAAVENLARQIPQAVMALVPDARHLVMVDRPDAVALLIGAFLARVEVTAEDRS